MDVDIQANLEKLYGDNLEIRAIIRLTEAYRREQRKYNGYA